MMKFKRGYTLTEVVTVVAVLSIVSTFGLRSFSKASEKNDERVYYNFVQDVKASVKRHVARSGQNLPTLQSSDDLIEILGVDISALPHPPTEVICGHNPQRGRSNYCILSFPGDVGEFVFHDNIGIDCPSGVEGNIRECS